MSRSATRPLSPHLTIWKWGPHMLVSILHRVTGVGMATVGTAVFVWWLVALAAGPDAYGDFRYWIVAGDGSAAAAAANLVARLVAIALTWALYQHLANGVRHLVMDIGAGFELRVNKLASLATLAFSVTMTLATWAYVASKGGL